MLNTTMPKVWTGNKFTYSLKEQGHNWWLLSYVMLYRLALTYLIGLILSYHTLPTGACG